MRRLVPHRCEFLRPFAPTPRETTTPIQRDHAALQFSTPRQRADSATPAVGTQRPPVARQAQSPRRHAELVDDKLESQPRLLRQAIRFERTTHRNHARFCERPFANSAAVGEKCDVNRFVPWANHRLSPGIQLHVASRRQRVQCQYRGRALAERPGACVRPAVLSSRPRGAAVRCQAIAISRAMCLVSNRQHVMYCNGQYVVCTDRVEIGTLRKILLRGRLQKRA
jgi:hypothetical protein